MRHLLPLCLLAACPADVPQGHPPPDLTVPLGPDQVLAGVITQEASLWGGAAAEGRPGDLLLYNDRVRFVIQGMREGGGLAHQGGGVIDADWIPAAGQAGHDLVHDWIPMVDVGTLVEPSAVEVVDDGTVSGVARVRTTGRATLLDYLIGAVEAAGIFPVIEADFVTEFSLEAGSSLLRVETTITPDEALTGRLGDVLNNVPGLGDAWVPGLGRTAMIPSELPWLAYVDREQHYTLAMFRDGVEPAGPHAALTLVNALLSTSSLYGEAQTIEAGAAVTFTRWYGVGPDLGTLTDAWLEALEEPTRTVEATVVATDGPVAGARVTVLVDDAPFTLAITDAEGRVEVDVPEGAEVGLVADGSGSRVLRDLPDGLARYGPLAVEAGREAALTSWGAEVAVEPQSRGRGRVEGAAGELTLDVPGTLRVEAGDGLPFEARLTAVDGGPVDDGLGWGPAEDFAALAYALDGAVDVPVEPGTYDLLVHRGVRYEAHSERVTVVAGEVTTVNAALTEAYEASGWWTADTHLHAAPSSDGKVSMRDRLAVSAAGGVQIHVATEHDVLADYAPLVAPLGLTGVVGTIAGVEISPVRRGHANLFPIVADPDAPAGGAWRFWLNPVASTTEQFEALRAVHPDAVVQINHPFSPGMPVFAGWAPGEVERGDFWYGDFDALEVVKGGGHDEELALYLDLVNHGIVTAAMGNTDSHTLRSNNPGLNVTFVAMDLPNAGAVTGEVFAEAIRARRTIATNGPFLDLSILPGTVITAPSVLEVAVRAPSWIRVDRIELLRDGVLAEAVDGTEASFTLSADQDASFVVVASGAQPVQPVAGHAPWAMSSAILLDLDGDGWEAPMGELMIGGP